MKLAASVSLISLALVACATTAAAPAPGGAAAEPLPPPPAINTGPARTVEGARQFIANVEKELGDLTVIGGRAAWVNATYINDDTDALNAYFGTILTEKGVQYAKEAAEFSKVPGLDFDTARK